jgi:hypothetical protein
MVDSMARRRASAAAPCQTLLAINSCCAGRGCMKEVYTTFAGRAQLDGSGNHSMAQNPSGTLASSQIRQRQCHSLSVHRKANRRCLRACVSRSPARWPLPPASLHAAARAHTQPLPSPALHPQQTTPQAAAKRQQLAIITAPRPS